MNKKILVFSLIGLLAIGIVSAIGYYALFSVSFNVLPSITIEGETSQELGEVYGGEEIEGTQIEITNNAPTKRVVTITDDSEFSVSYVSELTLSQKVVDFGNSNWELTGDTAIVRYVVVGDEFKAEVISGEKEGYELFYYKDNSDRFSSPAKAIKVNEVTDYLPYEDDANIEYNYCELDGYKTCYGAKIWYLPSNAVDNGNVDWSRASEFLFETNLIQYSDEITIYPDSSLVITPIYNIPNYASGEYEVTTTIA